MTTRAIATVAAALAGSLLSGCARVALDPVRFHNRAPVQVVNDRDNIPETPRETKFVRFLYHFDGFVHRRFTRWSEMRPERRAQNVNSMDEVPDSTWFTNRIGVREMTVDEVRRGPNREPGPMAHKPWTIKSSKVGGISIGFIIEDAAGDRYLLKFDGKDHPEMETAADVIVARLLWASGYKVPEDYVVSFRPEELRIGDGALVKKLFGDSEPLTADLLAESLGKVSVNADGSIRALTSRFIAGKPIGGWARTGTRGDDPNDLVAHELRRDLRGAYPFFAWLSHADMKEDNSLDVWVEDPDDPSIHYVAHYLIDFGKALGVQEWHGRVRYLSHAYILDFADALRSGLTLGLYRRPWEKRAVPALPGIGLYESKSFRPGAWKTYTPSYFPFHETDRFDGFWGAKILIRFTEPMIRAVVGEAKLSDPRSSAYLTKTIVERQRITARYWFARVNPLDRFTIEDGALCFTDLAIEHRLERVPTHYVADGFDYDARPTGWTRRLEPDASGRVCATDLGPTGSRDGYLILRLRTVRPGRLLPETLVHLALDPVTGRLRVIGLRRL